MWFYLYIYHHLSLSGGRESTIPRGKRHLSCTGGAVVPDDLDRADVAAEDCADQQSIQLR